MCIVFIGTILENNGISPVGQKAKFVKLNINVKASGQCFVSHEGSGGDR